MTTAVPCEVEKGVLASEAGKRQTVVYFPKEKEKGKDASLYHADKGLE